MPSGSHSGSPGSHSSGGSSYGGSSSSGSHSSSSSSSSSSSYSSSHSSSYYGPSSGGYYSSPYYGHYSYGSVYVAPRPRMSKKAIWTLVLGVLYIIPIVLLLFFALMFPVHRNELTKIKVDADYYSQMIETAKTDSRLIVNGQVTDKYYNESAKRWYVTYKFVAQDGSVVYGYSFSSYTTQTAANYTIGGTILLAVDRYPTDNDTDSIPMEYRLKDDGEYIVVKKRIAVDGSMIALSVVLMAALAYGIVMVQKKLGKKETKSAETATTNNKSTNFCAYCGSALEGSSTKCKNCGASLKSQNGNRK